MNGNGHAADCKSSCTADMCLVGCDELHVSFQQPLAVNLIKTTPTSGRTV